MTGFCKNESAGDSIHHLLEGLKHADASAITGLWRCYFSKLVRLARQRLIGMQKTVVDEEDVALSVFNSLCCRAERGEFHTLEDRDDLWRILVTLTRSKAADAIRWAGRLKRNEKGLTQVGVDLLPSEEPSPELLVSLVEQRQHLLRQLPDESCRKIALKKLDGETDAEIAVELDITDRTVRRKMQLIRAIWSAELTEHDLPQT